MKKGKSHKYPSQLVLGGHSFIPELGNDPAIDFGMQLEIVQECLDQGINCFDTTYEPERIALGRVLETLARRDEAQIIAWNFFADSSTGEYLVGPRPFAEEHIELLLHQLRTDYIDLLVVHGVKDDEKDKEQSDIAQSWVASGKVGSLGIWAPWSDPATQSEAKDPYEFVVMPRSIEDPNTDRFRCCKAIGLQTFATSAFGRGWLLDRLVAIDVAQTSEAPGTSRARIADALLRFSIHDSHVDHLIVGIRNKEWISCNLESVRLGPLSEEEAQWLSELLARVQAADTPGPAAAPGAQ